MKLFLVFHETLSGVHDVNKVLLLSVELVACLYTWYSDSLMMMLLMCVFYHHEKTAVIDAGCANDVSHGSHDQ